MTIDIEGMNLEYARVYSKRPYKMEEAIYCKVREHGIETKKAVEITMSLEKMLRDCFPNGKDTHLTEEELND